MVIEVSIKWAESDVRQIYPLEKKIKKKLWQTSSKSRGKQN